MVTLKFKRKRLLLVFGTRPEAIKIAPLVKEFEKNRESFETIVTVTGQHREMLDQVLELFEIVPHYDLNIMQKGQDLYDVTSRVLVGMKDVLQEVQPDIVFVHGDTTTSMATALAAFYKQIPVAHIEAGLRSHKRYSPWPEELNRQLTGRLATYHFSPTKLSRENLLRENVPEENIWVTGNTVIDALHWVLNKIEKTPNIENKILDKLDSYGLSHAFVSKWVKGGDTRLVLITGHRRENFGSGFLNICNAIKCLAERFENVDFVYPMHLNPNVREPIKMVFGDSLDSQKTLGNVHFIEPLDYLPFVYLMNKSYLVLTDSGGIQEEAPGLGKPVLVMRETTERPEAVDAGTVRLVGTNQDLIVNEVTCLLNDEYHYSRMSRAHNPYGNGQACNYISSALREMSF